MKPRDAFDTPRPLPQAIREINEERAKVRLPLLDPAEFLRKIEEPLVGVATTAVLVLTATLWIVS